ncbi:methyltransferase domain-containing protein [Streptacidiphilus sp. EB129]|uniref:methyltransferase domain-containing protein n=1 Tax=Streptacidiphilus sp. EB129 TaxID=3156262 RepID=UPI003511EAD3
MPFEPYAARLSAACVHPASRWAQALAAVPRHVFVPRWWQPSTKGWTCVDGPSDPEPWMTAAYADRTLVTRVGPLHADHAKQGQHAAGLPTSSATLPGLVVQMLRHAMIPDGADVLCIVGSGYTPAVLTRRLGADHVTGADLDPYLVDAAAQRLDSIGLRPRLEVCDITGPLPGTFDRIVSTVSVHGVPASWLAALRTGGRLVTTLADTALVVTADKADDGSAAGHVTEDRAGFMPTRTGEDYPAPLMERAAGRDALAGADTVTQSPFPVINVREAWEVWSMFSLTVPGVEHRYRAGADGTRSARMVHPDGSWARATSHGLTGPATVEQGGPRRLWDELDRIRRRWLAEGSLPVYGARVEITPDGHTHLSRGAWSATVNRPTGGKHHRASSLTTRTTPR